MLQPQCQCDQQEFNVSPKSVVRGQFRRRVGLHLVSRWVPISSRGPISSKKVDPGTGIDFHMILGSRVGGAQILAPTQLEGNVPVQGCT